jgi:hypothetical protein
VNIQQTIIKGIKEQLFLNNYLVLPGFGGFVLKSQAAHFVSGGAQLKPPSKTISFNSQLRQNDGLLSIWLQNNLKCTAEESLRHLVDFSEYCTSILNAKRRLSIQDIGFFYLDFENNICFEPQPDSNFLTGSFGLSPISLHVIQRSEEPRKPVFTDRQVPSEHKTYQKKTSYRKFILPTVLTLLVIGLLGFIISGSRITGVLRSSLFNTGSTGKYIPLHYPDLNLKPVNDLKKPYVIDANGIATIEIDNKEIAVMAIPGLVNKKEHSRKHGAPVTQSKNYEIILGCFTVKENAQRLVSNLASKNIHAYISSRNQRQMYVVSFGGYDTKQQAASQLPIVQNVIPGAWIRKH